jgi:hypothetical protein
MANAVDVPPQFTGNTLVVPNTAHANPAGTLYVRLRDDPATVQALNLPVTPAGPLNSSGASAAAEAVQTPSAATTAANAAAAKPDAGTDTAAPSPH